MPQTTKFTVTLTPELIQAVKEKAKEIFGKRKGAISHYVEMIFRNELHLIQEGVEEP